MESSKKSCVYTIGDPSGYLVSYYDFKKNNTTDLVNHLTCKVGEWMNNEIEYGLELPLIVRVRIPSTNSAEKLANRIVSLYPGIEYFCEESVIGLMTHKLTFLYRQHKVETHVIADAPTAPAVADAPAAPVVADTPAAPVVADAPAAPVAADELPNPVTADELAAFVAAAVEHVRGYSAHVAASNLVTGRVSNVAVDPATNVACAPADSTIVTEPVVSVDVDAPAAPVTVDASTASAVASATAAPVDVNALTAREIARMLTDNVSVWAYVGRGMENIPDGFDDDDDDDTSEASADDDDVSDDSDADVPSAENADWKDPVWGEPDVVEGESGGCQPVEPEVTSEQSEEAVDAVEIDCEIETEFRKGGRRHQKTYLLVDLMERYGDTMSTEELCAIAGINDDDIIIQAVTTYSRRREDRDNRARLSRSAATRSVGGSASAASLSA